MQVTTIFCDLCSEEIKEHSRKFTLTLSGSSSSVSDDICVPHLHKHCFKELVLRTVDTFSFPNAQRNGVFRDGWFKTLDV